MFTADRRSRFSFDKETQVSYRHERMAEEQYYMESMNEFMSDVTVRDEGSANAMSHGDWRVDSEGEGHIGFFSAGGSISASGSHNADSHRDFLRELTRHVEASDRRSVTATRAAHSVQVGEVQTRTHAEGESENHFEASSRVFSNPNRCQTVRFTIENIERRVIDPAVNTEVTNNPPRLAGGVSVIPTAVLATDTQRLEVEATGRSSIASQQQAAAAPAGVRFQATRLSAAQFAGIRAPAREPIPAQVREQVLQPRIFNLMFYIPTFQRPSASLFIGARAR